MISKEKQIETSKGFIRQWEAEIERLKQRVKKEKKNLKQIKGGLI